MTRDIQQQILELATLKFYRYGFHKISMDSLVEELHISKSTLYKYFPSKEDLVRAIIINYTREVDEKARTIIHDPQVDFRQKLVLFTNFYGEMISRLSPAFLHDVEVITPALWKEGIDRRLKNWQVNFKELFQQGIEQGVLRGDIHIDLLVLAYTKVTEIAYAPVIEEMGLSQAEAYTLISQRFMEGTLTDKGRRLFTDEDHP